MRLFSVVAVLAITGYLMLPENVWVRTVWQVTTGYAATAAILLGAHRLPRADRLPWWCFAAGVFLNTTGIPVSVVGEIYFGFLDLPTPADPFFLGLYPACALGLGVLVWRRDRRRDWTALVDAATITTGFGLLAWVYVIEPQDLGDRMNRWAHATQVAYPIGDLLLIGMMTRLLRSGGSRGPSLWLITGALAAFLIGDTAWVVLGNLGEFGVMLENARWFRRPLESVFLIGFLLFGVAALHADARQVAAAAETPPARLGRGLLALLAGASLIAPALLAVQLHHGTVVNGWALVFGSTTLFLLVVVRMAMLVRETERQARQVRDLARSDELTGLPNRRAWNDELPRALERARRDRTPVAVAFLDLDHFKVFNDTHGHPAGDRLLKAAAAAWHSALREVDLIARYGGEEFVVLLPGAGAAEARQILARALESTPLGQTFSAGVALWDGSETSDELLKRSDAALYVAKANGRSRVELASDNWTMQQAG
ncbi:diguanylate cyclase (GGDEF)-like protein [Actinoplanes lutulentus]|uniref:Diguanylate cyclase (GGDEF)-like protein n=1 Tax=Actinoplanes lutulentus TaxID=1287878 RepID=A0A327ZJE5_9ACTN|nr:GGDEF domain-containing protein [Actinoplanes lutulentus]MBB2944004.1 diguanylate cyclase (GGDEF)-like protein [Actinoplanes lutulentus]RAK42763.1 diguanylate cyclase (GGDEF)-like protein [Actinoplanes lutulentus]